MIRSDYTPRPEPAYFNDVDPNSEIIHQPDVYTHAVEIAETLGATRLIDIGCGKAGKLMQLADRFEVIGVDYGPNLAWCRDRYSSATWIEQDLEQPRQASIRVRDSVVICADVIEHLRGPQCLVDWLLEMLQAGAKAILISTPEREGTYGPWHLGPPPNVCHVREWTIRELTAMLRRAGFQYGSIGLTRNNTAEDQSSTILCVYVKDEDSLTLVEDVLIQSPAR